MAAKTNVKVSTHEVRGKIVGFKKMIGGERFFFGRDWGVSSGSKADERQAQRIAEQLDTEHDRLRLQGQGWTAASKAEAVNRVRSILGLSAVEPSVSPSAAKESPRINLEQSGTVSTADRLLTLSAAIDAFKADQDERFATRKISLKQRDSLKRRIDDAKAAFPNPGVPLTSIGRDQLQAAVNHWLKRPISAKTGEKIAVLTVVSRVGALGQFFRWCYNAEKWDGFRAWETLFAVDGDALMSPAEKQAAKQGKPKFTIAELATLYANATLRQRLYILLALNCGFGQTEIATLRHWDLHLDPPADASREQKASFVAYIERRRNKTNVEGKWELWKETADLLRVYCGAFGGYVHLAPETAEGIRYERPNLHGAQYVVNKPTFEGIDEPETLALRSEDGYPLVHGKTDSIDLSWRRLYAKKAVKAKKVRRLGFYSLRHTAAQRVRDLAGYETHKIFMAHATLEASGRKGVSERYYTQRSEVDFGKVAFALRTFRTQLDGMFTGKIEEKKEQVA